MKPSIRRPIITNSSKDDRPPTRKKIETSNSTSSVTNPHPPNKLDSIPSIQIGKDNCLDSLHKLHVELPPSEKEAIPTRIFEGVGLNAIFPFDNFNKLQSECFEQIFFSNQNMIISAPTASGKTVLFE